MASKASKTKDAMGRKDLAMDAQKIQGNILQQMLGEAAASPGQPAGQPNMRPVPTPQDIISTVLGQIPHPLDPNQPDVDPEMMDQMMNKYDPNGSDGEIVDAVLRTLIKSGVYPKVPMMGDDGEQDADHAGLVTDAPDL